MLTEEQLEIIGEAIQPLFQYLEQEVITDIARRIKNTMTYTRTAELQALFLQELGYSPAKIRSEAMKLLNADAKYRMEVAKNTAVYKKKIRRLIQDITNEAYKISDEIVANAGDMSWASDLTVWRQAGKELTDKSFLPQVIKGIQEQTIDALRNITQTTGFKTMSGYEGVQDLYRRELDKAVIKLCTGTFDQDKVLRDVVHDLAKSGLRTIDYSSGYSMQLDTAARVALRTGCHQLAGKIQNRNILDSGVNLVHVKSHWGARNTGIGHANHESWQGKVYCIKPADYTAEAKRIGQDSITDLWEATGYSIDGSHANDPVGLFGYNCRHLYFAFFEGVSQVHEPQKEPGPFTVDGKEYDYFQITQKLRKMERDIRAMKREKDALKALGLNYRDMNVKISKATNNYERVCGICQIPKHTTKLRYESGSADLTKTKAYQDYKKEIASIVKNGTIEVKIPDAKVNNFFLKDGAKHANEFYSVGYSVADGDLLKSDLVKGYSIKDIIDIKELPSGGRTYSIFMDLGKEVKKPFRTVWREDEKASIPRIITAHREDIKNE